MPLTRNAIISEARSWIGTRYRHQASVKGVGCDCLGLIRGVWREMVGEEPEPMRAYAPDWAEATGEETLALIGFKHLVAIEPAQIAPGDVLLFRWREGYIAKHAAIVSDDGRMIHAHDGAAVCEVALVPWWRRRIAFAFAFPGVID